MKKSIKKSRIEFLASSLQPNYMLSLQLPHSCKAYKFERFRSYIKSIMKQVEKHLLDKKWNKHHYRFVVFYENKNGLDAWHAHILINCTDKTTGKTEKIGNIEKAITKANHVFRCDNGCKENIDVDISQLNSIKSVQSAIDYCQKEAWNENKPDNTDVRYEFSENLFSL